MKLLYPLSPLEQWHCVRHTPSEVVSRIYCEVCSSGGSSEDDAGRGRGSTFCELISRHELRQISQAQRSPATMASSSSAGTSRTIVSKNRIKFATSVGIISM